MQTLWQKQSEDEFHSYSTYTARRRVHACLISALCSHLIKTSELFVLCGVPMSSVEELLHTKTKYTAKIMHTLLLYACMSTEYIAVTISFSVYKLGSLHHTHIERQPKQDVEYCHLANDFHWDHPIMT